MNEELKLREIEITREASECAALMKIFISSESGSRDKVGVIGQKVLLLMPMELVKY